MHWRELVERQFLKKKIAWLIVIRRKNQWKNFMYIYLLFFSFGKFFWNFIGYHPPPPFSKYTPPTPPRRKPWTSPDEMQPWTLQKPWLECPSDPSDMAGLWVEKTSSVINLANNKKTFFFFKSIFLSAHTFVLERLFTIRKY